MQPVDRLHRQQQMLVELEEPLLLRVFV